MTLPSERTSAIQQAREFLFELLDPAKTKRVPKAIRLRARQILRHFPGDLYLEEAARKAPGVLGKPYPSAQQARRNLDQELWLDQYRDQVKRERQAMEEDHLEALKNPNILIKKETT